MTNNNLLLPGGDEDPLASLEKKLQLLRDHVTGVARGFKNGLFLYGSGGMGKSYTVLRHLEKLEAPYQLFNGRMTGKGLFLTLGRAPDAVHVLEDMERLTRDPDAQGVLRSALWAQPGHDRIVTWTTATDGAQRFVFRGGLILISNRPLADLPELRALATRIEVHRLDVTEAELAAQMRHLAGQGYRQHDKTLLGPDECLQVTEHVLRECRAAGCPLDLRLQQKGFQTYLQWREEYCHCDWRDLLAASVREATYHFRHETNPLPREARRTQRRSVLRDPRPDRRRQGTGAALRGADGQLPRRLLPPQGRGRKRGIRRRRCRVTVPRGTSSRLGRFSHGTRRHGRLSSDLRPERTLPWPPPSANCRPAPAIPTGPRPCRAANARAQQRRLQPQAPFPRSDPPHLLRHLPRPALRPQDAQRRGTGGEHQTPCSQPGPHLHLRPKKESKPSQLTSRLQGCRSAAGGPASLPQETSSACAATGPCGGGYPSPAHQRRAFVML